jgi:hypothetical protein
MVAHLGDMEALKALKAHLGGMEAYCGDMKAHF